MAEVPLGVFKDLTHRRWTILHSSPWYWLMSCEILCGLPVHTCP